MDYTDDELFVFIRRELRTHSNILMRIFRSALDRNKNIDTGHLRRNIRRVELGRLPDGGVHAVIEFPMYGRAMEIGGRQRQRNRNHDTWVQRNHKPKKTNWYARNMYTGSGILRQKLSAGISEHELQEIRNIVEASGLARKTH